jgi:hypothetical protein
MKIITRKEAAMQGLTRYYTNTSCARGHLAERLVTNYACVECASITNKRYEQTEKGMGARRAVEKRYYKTEKGKLTHKEYNARYEQTERGKEIRTKIWKNNLENNSAACSARVRQYQIQKIQNTPTWASFEKIKAFYEKAQLLTAHSGEKHEVDHIVPINGKNVCGLHCEDNLQVLTKIENILKSNNFYD